MIYSYIDSDFSQLERSSLWGRAHAQITLQSSLPPQVQRFHTLYQSKKLLNITLTYVLFDF